MYRVRIIINLTSVILCKIKRLSEVSLEIMIDLLSFSKMHPESVVFLIFLEKHKLLIKLETFLPRVKLFLLPILCITFESDRKTISSGWLKKFSLTIVDFLFFKNFEFSLIFLLT